MVVVLLYRVVTIDWMLRLWFSNTSSRSPTARSPRIIRYHIVYYYLFDLFDSDRWREEQSTVIVVAFQIYEPRRQFVVYDVIAFPIDYDWDCVWDCECDCDCNECTVNKLFEKHKHPIVNGPTGKQKPNELVYGLWGRKYDRWEDLFRVGFDVH